MQCNWAYGTAAAAQVIITYKYLTTNQNASLKINAVLHNKTQSIPCGCGWGVVMLIRGVVIKV